MWPTLEIQPVPLLWFSENNLRLPSDATSQITQKPSVTLWARSVSPSFPGLSVSAGTQEESILQEGAAELSFKECMCVILSKGAEGVLAGGTIQLCEGKHWERAGEGLGALWNSNVCKKCSTETSCREKGTYTCTPGQMSPGWTHPCPLCMDPETEHSHYPKSFLVLPVSMHPKGKFSPDFSYPHHSLDFPTFKCIKIGSYLSSVVTGLFNSTLWGTSLLLYVFMCCLLSMLLGRAQQTF